MAKKKILVTETILRDAHQSLIATRMTMDEMLPILPQLDKVGFHSLECWGGATFDSCLRFLNEDPWERLRTIRKNCPNTKLQMLFRGQNMLGYRHYADDVLEYFVQKSVANGIDIIRIFDALNDIDNLKTAVKAAKKEGAHAQIAISYTTGPVFDTKYYVDYAKRIANIGADSICIKDMAALLTPYHTEELVKAIKKAVKLPVQIHTHYTSGLASMCLLKGVEAGADIIDTAMSPLALGTSHAPTESMVAALKDTDYDTGLDLVALTEIRDYFMTLRKKYLDSGLLDEASELCAMTEYPSAKYLGAYIACLKGDTSKSDALIKEANAASPEYVFPFRPEMIKVFDWANGKNPDWKLNYYKALILWRHAGKDKAAELMESCGNQPDYNPFYLTRAILRTGNDKLSDLKKAESISQDWRTGKALYGRRQKRPRDLPQGLPRQSQG